MTAHRCNLLIKMPNLGVPFWIQHKVNWWIVQSQPHLSASWIRSVSLTRKLNFSVFQMRNVTGVAHLSMILNFLQWDTGIIKLQVSFLLPGFREFMLESRLFRWNVDLFLTKIPFAGNLLQDVNVCSKRIPKWYVLLPNSSNFMHAELLFDQYNPINSRNFRICTKVEFVISLKDNIWNSPNFSNENFPNFTKKTGKRIHLGGIFSYSFIGIQEIHDRKFLKNFQMPCVVKFSNASQLVHV